MQKHASTLVFAAAVAFSMSSVHSLALAQGQSTSAMTEGEVRKIDKDAGKLTIRHGEIKNLDMPPMTMVFRVKEPVTLDNLKPGDKIRFRAEKIGGQYTVVGVEPVK